MKHVLVVLPVEDRHVHKLEEAGKGCSFDFTFGEEPTAERIAQADVILGNVPAERICASERLELLQLSSAGADPYIKPGVLASNTVLCNATGAYGKAVSEHAFAMTLMLQKKLHLYRDAQRGALWSDAGTVVSMADAVVLVVGLGDIGLRFARMCKAMGAYVIGVRRRAGERPEGVDELCLTEELDALLPRADVVASFLPGSPGTYHTYTAERFARMKESAIFINCGRGGAVDGAVLADALQQGRIAAAGIDVTDPEPLPADSPLWALDNLMITPHVSGFYHLPETFERVVDIAAENLSAHLAGRPLRNVVDFETGYKR
ncbi:MAG: D-2-hydroxyacid dehydrogenase [Oscillospiraceae bacterium]|nr:D-2-hydroxyacid dehydrogenase [Oscillospiraceae bacterium]